MAWGDPRPNAALILQADPEVTEEWKWVKPRSLGTPVWSHNGLGASRGVTSLQSLQIQVTRLAVASSNAATSLTFMCST